MKTDRLEKPWKLIQQIFERLLGIIMRILSIVLIFSSLSSFASAANTCDSVEVIQGLFCGVAAVTMNYKTQLSNIELQPNEALIIESDKMSEKIQLNEPALVGKDYVLQLTDFIKNDSSGAKYYSANKLGSQNPICIMVNDGTDTGAKFLKTADSIGAVATAMKISGQISPFKVLNTIVVLETTRSGLQIDCLTNKSPDEVTLEDLQKYLPSFEIKHFYD